MTQSSAVARRPAIPLQGVVHSRPPSGSKALIAGKLNSTRAPAANSERIPQVALAIDAFTGNGSMGENPQSRERCLKNRTRPRQGIDSSPGSTPDFTYRALPWEKQNETRFIVGRPTANLLMRRSGAPRGRW